MQDTDDTSSNEEEPENQVTSYEDIKNGNIKILFGSPEAFLEVEKYRDTVKKLQSEDLICSLICDEAHCVLKYGYNRKTRSGKVVKAFRPAYAKLRELRAILGDTPMVCLTATLTTENQKMLIEKLHLGPQCFILTQPPVKNNITYHVHQLNKEFSKEESGEYFDWLKELLACEREHLKKTLIFFHSRERQSLVYEYLDEELGYYGHALPPPHSVQSHLFEMYHMKNDDSVKDIILNQFAGSEGHLQCILASSSISMGIDICYTHHPFWPCYGFGQFSA